VIGEATARVVANPMAGPAPVWSPYDRGPLELHHRLPGYEPTPLLDAPALAAELGLGGVLVKAETSRFGLPAFKMLGASWATYRAVVDHLGEEPTWRTPGELAEALRPLLPFSLAAATDGNHGRAVARMARLLGFGAHIFVPAGTVAARIDAIAGEGAEVSVVDGDYDAAIARAAEEAGPRCLVISDTAWEGYDRVPRWVVEGYSTMFWEVTDRLEAAGRGAPDVVVVPVGVGALAAAAVNHWRREGSTTSLVSVEPVGAECFLRSVEAGHPVTTPGPHPSIMVGLNCGTPSPVAWPLVTAGFDTFVAVGDDAARQAMRRLAALGVPAGETGAAALAGLTALQRGDTLWRVGPDATVLVLTTEGPTDPTAWWGVLGVEVV